MFVLIKRLFSFAVFIRVMEYNDKQVQIMEAAEKLFAEQGFAGTSVRDIAEAAHVNLAMISYYFGSKEKLMEAMFHHRGVDFKLQLENILQNKNLSPIQKVEKLIDDYIERIFKKQSFHKIMAREQMVSSSSPITEQIYEMKQRNFSLIKELIHQGQKAGQFKKNIDISLLMMTLTGTSSQLVTAQHYYRKINHLEDMPVEELEKLMKKKLSIYLKNLFKAVLTYEG
jgi:AcrR family transcriptional regulator